MPAALAGLSLLLPTVVGVVVHPLLGGRSDRPRLPAGAGRIGVLGASLVGGVVLVVGAL